MPKLSFSYLNYNDWARLNSNDWLQFETVSRKDCTVITVISFGDYDVNKLTLLLC